MIRYQELEEHFPWLATGEPVTAELAGAQLTGLYRRLKEEQERDEPLRLKYVEAAQEHHLLSEGTLEVDDSAIVSMGGDPGAYVQAWLWVENSRIGLCDCGEPLAEGDDVCAACCEKEEAAHV